MIDYICTSKKLNPLIKLSYKLLEMSVSGPSTLKQVSEDLGLSYTLGQRTVSAFENINVVENRARGIYAIATEALPVVIFCLRETCGLDLLSNLDI